MSTSTSRATSVLAITGSVLAGSMLAYVVYFDYRRRNDVAFRRKLRTFITCTPHLYPLFIRFPLFIGAEKKQIEKKAQKHAEEAKIMEARSLTMTRDEITSVFKKSKEELANLPQDQKERMNYCLGLLSAADQMIQGTCDGAFHPQCG